ncbi:MAG: tetratricopeptide repeat protein, partial [Proteobacteria bacterium]|nr:tetratricopeptide repeat protein [Pseudomonadota bacterium]
VMSDGEFDNAPDKLESDINLSMMGFGTKIGAPVPQNNGALLRRGGEVVISKLDEDKMRHLVQNGIYVQANYLDNDVKALLKLMENNYDNAQKTQESKIRYYNEIFYIPVGLMLVIMLLLFAKRAPIFVIALLLYSNAAQANPFLNQEQNAKKAFKQQDYEAAIKGFGDNAYNKGVAQYRAGQYKQASDSFAKAVSQRLGNMDTDKEAAANASYNLGNSYFQQQQFDKAIKAYETALQQKADFDDAKHNLELAKKKLQEQEKNKDNKQDQQQQQNQQNQSQQDKQNQQQESGEQNKEEQKGEEGEENKEQDQQESEDEKQQGEEQEKEADQEEQPTPSPEEQQRDFEADKQLNRIESNPANILKNQFYIEEQQFLSKEKK